MRPIRDVIRPHVVMVDVPQKLIAAVMRSAIRYESDIGELPLSEASIRESAGQPVAAALVGWSAHNGHAHLIGLLRSVHPQAVIIAICDDLAGVADARTRCREANCRFAAPVDYRTLTKALAIAIDHYRGRD
jgi:hypothetical protein